MADPELVARIAASTDLTAQEADRVIEDVLAWYREPLTDFVRRRHAQQQAAGVRNEQIYRQLAAADRAPAVRRAGPLDPATTPDHLWLATPIFGWQPD